MPTKVEVYQLQDINTATTIIDVNIELVRTYPDDVTGMSDLSPTSYFTYAQLMRDDEFEAIVFKNIQNFDTNATWWETILDNPNKCDQGCRQQLYCKSAYSVNEQIIECFEKMIDFRFTADYFVGIYQNPWFYEEAYTNATMEAEAAEAAAEAEAEAIAEGD